MRERLISSSVSAYLPWTATQESDRVVFKNTDAGQHIMGPLPPPYCISLALSVSVFPGEKGCRLGCFFSLWPRARFLRSARVRTHHKNVTRKRCETSRVYLVLQYIRQEAETLKYSWVPRTFFLYNFEGASSKGLGLLVLALENVNRRWYVEAKKRPPLNMLG